MKKVLPFLIALCLFYSCDDTTSVDCSTVLCAGPATLVFEVLVNGENVFDTGMMDAEDVSISGDFPDAFELQVEESNYNGGTRLLFVEQIQWEVRNYNFQIEVNAAQSEALSVSIQLSDGDCCGGIPQISSYRVNTTTLDNPNQVVTINLQ